MKRKKALRKNIAREISRTKSRFISIFAIIAISVGFFTGVKSACPSMMETARRYFEEQNLMDIQLISTVGFDDEDAETVRQMAGVSQVMPSYGADLMVREKDVDAAVKVMALPTNGGTINLPLLREGRMPEKDGECLMESYYARLEDKKIGDTIVFSQAGDMLKNTEYQIVGIADSPMYVAYFRGNTNIGSGSIAFYIMVRPEEFLTERYTRLYVKTDQPKEKFEELSEQCLSRFRVTTYADAKTRLADARREYEKQKKTALQTIRDGEQKLHDGEQEFAQKMAEGQQKLTDGEKELADAKQQIADGTEEAEAKLADAKQQLADARQKYNEGQEQYQQGVAEYNAKIREGQKQLDTAQREFDRQHERFYSVTKPQTEQKLATLQTSINMVNDSIDRVQSAIQRLKNIGWIADEESLYAQLEAYREELAEYQKQYDDGMAQLAEGERQLNDAKAQLDTKKEEFAAQKKQGEKQLSDAKAQLDKAAEQLAAGESAYQTSMLTGMAELQAAQGKIAQGEKELAAGKEELQKQKEAALEQFKQAREQLAKGKYEAHVKLSEAEEQLSEAEDKLSLLEDAKWYVSDREDDQGYAGLSEDAQRVDKVAKVFPLFFLIVAALVCLTTMSRMVEERRTEIGTLKALGYSNAAISAKYLIYAGTAGISGCLVGGTAGVLTLPKIIVDTYGIMYTLPETKLVVAWDSFCLSSLVAVVCICLVALLACRHDLHMEPATLMRPKAPKPGKRILLEHITPLWSRLNFTSKVTARNLFRYKARFLMTVIGVAGCTALIVAGFGLRDSITVIGDLQYGELTRYDQVYALTEAETADRKAYLMAKFHRDDRLSETLLSYMGWCSVGSEASDVVLNPHIVVGENRSDFERMFVLRDRETHEPVALDDSGVVIDERMGEVLKVKKEDRIRVVIDEEPYMFRVSDITENYAGNFVYMTPAYYEAITGRPVKYNAVIANVAASAKEQEHEIANDWMEEEDVMTVSLISEQVEAIMDTLDSLNVITFVMIFCAGLLAVVVLYNLTNINIAERVREIATIKVLGFYSMETANYIYRENIVLTLVGAAAGLLMGSMLSDFIVESIQMNNVMFAKNVTPFSYLMGFVLTFAFSMLVNFMMYFKMNRISMVESLKSIE